MDCHRDSYNIKQAVEYLNTLLDIDEKAILGLCKRRVECNDGLANHPSVQVLGVGRPIKQKTIFGEKVTYRKKVVGLLGVLNGMYSSVRKNQAIAVSFDSGKPRFVVDILYRITEGGGREIL